MIAPIVQQVTTARGPIMHRALRLARNRVKARRFSTDIINIHVRKWNNSDPWVLEERLHLLSALTTTADVFCEMSEHGFLRSDLSSSSFKKPHYDAIKPYAR